MANVISGRDPSQQPRAVEVTADGAVKVSAAAADDMVNPTVYNLTLVAANTEYNQALPVNARAVEFHARAATSDIRFAFEPGHVGPPAAPYMTLHGGQWYFSYRVNWEAVWTLYFGSANAGDVVEILVWR